MTWVADASLRPSGRTTFAASHGQCRGRRCHSGKTRIADGCRGQNDETRPPFGQPGSFGRKVRFIISRSRNGLRY